MQMKPVEPAANISVKEEPDIKQEVATKTGF